MTDLKSSVKKFGVGFAIATAALMVPTAAYAVGYVPEGNVSVSQSTVAPGGSATVTIAAGSFTPSESVAFTLEGENAAGATLAVVSPTVVNTKAFTKAADAQGGVAVTVTLPSDASGTYTLTGTGSTSGSIATATITVSSTSGGTGVLENSSADNALWAWVAGGALVLVGGAAATTVAVNRKRESA